MNPNVFQSTIHVQAHPTTHATPPHLPLPNNVGIRPSPQPTVLFLFDPQKSHLLQWLS